MAYGVLTSAGSRKHNFPHYPAYVATLPENTLTPDKLHCLCLASLLRRRSEQQNCRTKMSSTT